MVFRNKILLVAVFLLCQIQPANAYHATMEDVIDRMTLHQMICQMIVPEADDMHAGTPMTKVDDIVKMEMRKYPVGGILFPSSAMQSKEQVKKLMLDLDQVSDITLMKTCDEEGGSVGRLMYRVGTTKIGPMLSYEKEGREKAYMNAKTIAGDMSALGLNVDMAPVADTYSDPDNRVIADRAYSRDFASAARLVPEAVRGFHDRGVGTTLKHFPGHGGTKQDSHLGEAIVDCSLEELHEQELKPFQAGIAAGSDIVMVGHLSVPQVDPDHIAAFSSIIVTDLLRKEMGFGGVVITDGMKMGALDGVQGGEAAVRAVEAGCDMILQPHDVKETVSALEEAVESGRLSRRRIAVSVKRILIMKQNRGFFKIDDYVNKHPLYLYQ